jgi:hypothetical protein
MALAFVIGAGIALGLVALVGWVNLFRVWGAVALLLTVIFAWGLKGSAPGPATKRPPGPRARAHADAPEAGALPKEILHAFWYEQAKKNQEAALPCSSDPAQGVRDEINRIVALGKTAPTSFTNQDQRKDMR